MAYEIDEQKKIGLGLIGFGILFSFLAIILFFDRGLLALGNILWLAGVSLLLGWRSTLQIFTNRMNYKGSASILLGIFFIFVRWPILGIIMEVYGCIVLFGGFWPSVKVFLYQIPVIGWILRYPTLVPHLLVPSAGFYLLTSHSFKSGIGSTISGPLADDPIKFKAEEATKDGDAPPIGHNF